MTNQRIATVRQLYEALDRGDMERAAQLILNAEWHEAEGMPYAGHYQGAADIFENVFSRIAADVEGFRAETDELLPIGVDRVLALGHYVGTGAKRRLKAAYAHVWTVEAGTIVKFVQYADTHMYRQAIDC